MNSWKRIVPYLILNILVSAATTLIVLVVWDRVQHPTLSATSNGSLPSAASILSGSSEASTQEATLPPLDTPVIRIETVIGAGDLATETIQLQRIGEGDLQLAGWRLESGSKEYVFPNLTLNKNGSIRLCTRAGQSTVIELFWGLEKAAWKSGDTITLFDYAGNERASYTIP